MHFQKTFSISSMEEWFKYAPPKQGMAHWQNGRSAKELARAWFPDTGKPHFPPELRQLLDSRPETSHFRPTLAIPELVCAFDDIRAGETSNVDLVLMGECDHIPTVVGIEAKADEPFGNGTLAERVSSAKSTSKVPKRIANLCIRLFGMSLDQNGALGTLMYQLLTGLSGTLAEAKRRGAGQAVFVVHEFHSDRLDKGKTERNDLALAAFLKHLSLSDGSSPLSILFGPGRVFGDEIFIDSRIPYFIGKCRRLISDNCSPRVL